MAAQKRPQQHRQQQRLSAPNPGKEPAKEWAKAGAMAVTTAAANVAAVMAAVEAVGAIRAKVALAQKPVPSAARKVAMRAAQKIVRKVEEIAANVRTPSAVNAVMHHAPTVRGLMVRGLNDKTGPSALQATCANHGSRVNRVSHVKGAAASATAQGVVSAPSVASAHRAMLPSKTSRWPTRQPWQQPAVMAMRHRTARRTGHKIVPRQTAKAAQAEAAATTAGVSALMIALIVLIAAPMNSGMSAIQQLRQCLMGNRWTPAMRQRKACLMQQHRQMAHVTSVTRAKLMNPANAAAATVMAVSVVTAMSQAKPRRNRQQAIPTASSLSSSICCQMSLQANKIGRKQLLIL